MITIVDPGLTFTQALTNRTATTQLILHHAAGNSDVYAVHESHIAQNWAGIGYNFFIDKSGIIYKGRGWTAMGAHTENYNSNSIGVCFQGNWDEDSNFPDAQMQAGIAFIGEALSGYTDITTIAGHKHFNATACPGQYFPLEKMISCGRQYNNVRSATSRLVALGLMSSPEYWYNNFWKVDYLGDLLILLSQECKSTQTYHYSTVNQAVNRLVAAGIISSPDYWLANYSSLQHLGDLLIIAANHS